MIILHYTLGLAPYRSGGMTKYATDLMLEQQKSHRVALLYPSGYYFCSKKMGWKSKTERGLERIKLTNSFPIPLLYGIKTPSDFYWSRELSTEKMQSLYDHIKPDIFHVHTLMGLPKELLLFFKSKGVKLIFTTHDYFGICPKVNMIDYKGKVCNKQGSEFCEICNRGANSTLYLRIRNSQIALYLKNCKLIRKMIG